MEDIVILLLLYKTINDININVTILIIIIVIISRINTLNTYIIEHKRNVIYKVPTNLRLCRSSHNLTI